MQIGPQQMNIAHVVISKSFHKFWVSLDKYRQYVYQGCLLVKNSFVNISEVNRQAIYRTRSAGPNISQYIGSTRQTCNKLHFIAMHCSISHCTAKEEAQALVATTTYIYELISSITIHFYFLLCSFTS